MNRGDLKAISGLIPLKSSIISQKGWQEVDSAVLARGDDYDIIFTEGTTIYKS
ncbi:MAG TPA: hypothetical protein VN370_11780 [Desulfitobacteriaceae bacterium]|nr:hypothetical protein [Desulfitobacteriaceae bacterium]